MAWKRRLSSMAENVFKSVDFFTAIVSLNSPVTGFYASGGLLIFNAWICEERGVRRCGRISRNHRILSGIPLRHSAQFFLDLNRQGLPLSSICADARIRVSQTH